MKTCALQEYKKLTNKITLYIERDMVTSLKIPEFDEVNIKIF